MRPFLARFDHSWQLALEMERIEGGKVVIFLPSAPDPWSGSVYFMTGERLRAKASLLSAGLILFLALGTGHAGDGSSAAAQADNHWLICRRSTCKITTLDH